MSDNAKLNLDEMMRKAFSQGTLFLLSIGKKSWTTRLTPEMMGLKKFPDNWKLGRCLLLPEYRIEKVAANTEYMDAAELEEIKRRYESEEDSLRDLVEDVVMRRPSEPTQTRISEIYRWFKKALEEVSPIKRIDQLDGRSRGYLQKKAFSFGGNHNRFPFVRDELASEVLLELEKYQAEYFQQVDLLVESYEELKGTMRSKHPDQWELISPFYIPVAQIKTGYYFEIFSCQLGFPSKFDQVNVKALAKQKQMDEAYAAKAEAAWKRQEQQREDQLRNFVEESMRSLRTEVARVFTQTITSCQEKKQLDKGRIKALTEVIQQVKEMDFLNDVTFRSRLERIEESLVGAEKFNDSQGAVKKITDLLADTVNFVHKNTEADAVTMSSDYFSRKVSV